MRLAKRLTILLAVFLVAVAASSVCQGQQATYSSITGEFFTRSGTSNWLVGGRGLGPYEQFRAGANVVVRTKFAELYGSGTVHGATKYDNPEAFSMEFGAGFAVWPNLVVGLHFQDYYSLNRVPVSDPSARHPLSSVNQTWLGVEYRTRMLGNSVEVSYWRGIRGNLILFWPDHFTRPYASNRFALEYEQPLGRGFKLVLEPEVYTTDRFNQGRLYFEGTLEKPVWHGWIVITGTVVFNTYMGVTSERHFTGIQLRNYRRGAFVGVIIPFSHDEH